LINLIFIYALLSVIRFDKYFYLQQKVIVVIEKKNTRNENDRENVLYKHRWSAKQ